MVSVEDLKRIVLFEDLTDRMLENLLPMIQEASFEERQIIYEAGNRADRFYSLKRGKVLLEAELAPAIIISLGAIKPGYSFGWSALVTAASHTSYAVSAEPSEIFLMPADKFLALLERDHAMGYLVMHKMSRILDNRLERRTAQFLKVIIKHPEITRLLGM
ncbi:MAG: cyclic nucleotide-binding domain-containing protein [Desulfobacterales bacterium]|nr:cyclic nucleotide-binding domain-containing protein [Desulfobacterales bacterium]